MSKEQPVESETPRRLDPSRRVGGALSGEAKRAAPLFETSRARRVADRDVGVTLGDVVGCDEAKAAIVEFRLRPERFAALGTAALRALPAAHAPS